MATYTANQFIGKTLVAQKNLTAYYGHPGNKDTFTIYKGQNIGVVFSWVIKNTPDNKLWWEFESTSGRFYFVPGDPNYVGMNEFDKRTIKTVKQLAEEANEKDKTKDVAYYVEKWGKKILIGAAATYVVVQGFKIYIHDRSANRSKT